jgi:hypothetical protein
MSQIQSKRDLLNVKNLPEMLRKIEHDQNMLSHMYAQGLLPSRELVFLQS